MTDIGTIAAMIGAASGLLGLYFSRRDKRFDELRQEIHRSESRLENSIKGLKEEMREAIRDFREEMREFRLETRNNFLDLREKITQIEHDSIDLDKRIIVLETVRDFTKNETRSIGLPVQTAPFIRKRRGRPPSRPS